VVPVDGGAGLIRRVELPPAGCKRAGKGSLVSLIVTIEVRL